MRRHVGLFIFISLLWLIGSSKAWSLELLSRTYTINLPQTEAQPTLIQAKYLYCFTIPQSHINISLGQNEPLNVVAEIENKGQTPFLTEKRKGYQAKLSFQKPFAYTTQAFIVTYQLKHFLKGSLKKNSMTLTVPTTGGIKSKKDVFHFIFPQNIAPKSYQTTPGPYELHLTENAQMKLSLTQQPPRSDTVHVSFSPGIIESRGLLSSFSTRFDSPEFAMLWDLVLRDYLSYYGFMVAMITLIVVLRILIPWPNKRKSLLNKLLSRSGK